jgi:hypothetical protein
MMFIETNIATVILLGVALSGLAQEKPDFSGEWILNRQASTLSPGADAVQSGVWRIEHREPTFRHKATFVTRSNPIEYEYELLTAISFWFELLDAGRHLRATEQVAAPIMIRTTSGCSSGVEHRAR